MTLREASVILFIEEALSEVSKSLRTEQIAALSDMLDMTQKILLLEILSAVMQPNDRLVPTERQAAWRSLVEAAKSRSEAPFDAEVDPCLSGLTPLAKTEP